MATDCDVLHNEKKNNKTNEKINGDENVPIPYLVDPQHISTLSLMNFIIVKRTEIGIAPEWFLLKFGRSQQIGIFNQIKSVV